MLHAQKPNWVCAFVGGRIAVEEIAVALSRWPLPCFAVVKRADDLPLGELDGGGIVLMRWGGNRSVAEELKAC